MSATHPTRRAAIRRLAGLATGAAIVTTAAFAAPATDIVSADDGPDDAVVVANRGSGDVSVIDVDTLDVATFDLPGDAEPMYVSHDRRNGRVLVGDRAASTVVALDDESFAVIGSVAVGDGVFHQWLDPNRDQLWVVGDVSTSVTVIDADTLEVEAMIDIPADLVAQGGRPHDVFVSGRYAFVSVLGLADGSGAVLRYSTSDFVETGRITTGGDPHLFVRAETLYVASQDASTVTTYRVEMLREISSVAVPSAHGIWVTRDGSVLVTNIAGGGTDAVWDLGRRLTAGDVTDTVPPVPHNLAEKDGTVFVTHSGGTADQVSLVERDQAGFGESATVTVGTNPFGLAVVDR